MYIYVDETFSTSDQGAREQQNKTNCSVTQHSGCHGFTPTQCQSRQKNSR